MNTINIALKKNIGKQKPLPKEDLMKEEVRKINSFRMNIRIDFVEKVIKIQYVEILDVISELGGLQASAGALVGKIATIFLVSYFLTFSQMINRKDA